MNRTQGDEGDYTIEVFVSVGPWEEEVLCGMSLLHKLRRSVSLKSTIGLAEQTSGPRVHKESESFGDSYRLQRVRIRSQAVLDAVFDAIGNERFLHRKDPHIFCRPFRSLHVAFKDVKRRLDLMEQNQKPDYKLKLGSSEEEQRRSDHCLKDLRYFVEFVKSNILPLWSQFRSPELLTRQMVTYEEIPCLAKPGDLVYLQSELQAENEGLLSRHLLEDESRRWDPKPGRYSLSLSQTKWILYRLDFDGDGLYTGHHEVSFNLFHGEREITSLRCFPLSFHPNRDSILSRATTNGQLFKSHIYENSKIVHLYYSGWVSFSTAHQATDSFSYSGVNVKAMKHLEHVESEIVVDYKEAFRNCPRPRDSRKSPLGLYEGDPGSRERTSEAQSKLWTEQQATKAYDSTSSVVKRTSMIKKETVIYQEQELYKKDWEEYSEVNVFFKASGERLVVPPHEWTSETLAILPQIIYAYILREREFAAICTEEIDWDSRQRNVTLDDIEIKPSYRNLIRSAVSTHLRARDQERRGGAAMNLDIIRGKGKGLVILLHGAPGVGKTATAEAVAIEYQKPLFAITSEDLGTSSSSIERSFRMIFRYAHLWDCILLLDEADIFFTQRQRGYNTERNALVGVFLRVLEYYSGILFLTTNRVGAIDEAFSSRMHLSLWYKHLSLEYTIKILQNNLSRLPKYDKNKGTTDGVLNVRQAEIEKFIREEYVRYSKFSKKERGPWNGRQIRNAVQIASSLALYEKDCKDEDDGLPATLTADHFRSVASTMFEFEEFLRQSRVGDDTFHAKQRQERHDDFQSQD
ncbi:P-loop containing nucleoside triphosphate hydrolase protein, partial [Pestalotiopsis sp. NC0098]